MRLRGPSGAPLPIHAARQPGDAKADGLQRRLEQGVVLEAIAAAPAAYELGLEPIEVQPSRTADERIDGLEGDRGRMAGVERQQSAPVRPGRPSNPTRRK